MENIPPKVQNQLAMLQQLQQQLQTVAAQKTQYEMAIRESRRAQEELKDIPEDAEIFVNVGTVMVQQKKEKVVASLAEKLAPFIFVLFIAGMAYLVYRDLLLAMRSVGYGTLRYKLYYATVSPCLEGLAWTPLELCTMSWCEESSGRPSFETMETDAILWPVWPRWGRRAP